MSSVGTADKLAVSVEPDGGSQHPTVVMGTVPLA